MSDTSQDTGKNMWDFVNEVEAEYPPMRPRRRTPASVAPIASDVSADDPEADFAPELGAAELPVMELSAVEPVAADAPRQKRKLGGLIAAAVAVVAVGATAYIYTQGTQTAQSGSSPTAVVAEQASPVVIPVPTPAALPTPTPAPAASGVVRFTDALQSGSPYVVGKSLSDLVMASASLPPVAAMPASAWRDEECSSCHAWTKASLCDQGKWYETHGDAAVKRIGHPYGGGFKRGLQVWAKQGCQ